MSAADITYNVPSGSVLYAGRNAPLPPSGNPSWMASKAVNEWGEIPNTAGCDGMKIDAWCGYGLKQANVELIVGLAGGHDDDWSTQVSSIVLTADQPVWTRRREKVPFDQINYSQSVNGTPPPGHVFQAYNVYPYCKDGVTPSSRHTRYSSLYCSFNDRMMFIGSPSLYGYGGSQSGHSNGFSLATNEWDAPGTWPTGPDGIRGSCIDDKGNIWAKSHKWDRVTNTLITLPRVYSDVVCFDPVRRQLVDIVYGNGQGFDLPSGLIARTLSEDLTLQRTLTFNPSTAFNEFMALAPLDYPSFFYDTKRDRFYYYYGKGAGQGKVFIITPNTGTVWDFSVLPLGAGTIIPQSPTASGINARVQYSELLDAIVMIARKETNIYFMRLS